MARCRRSSASRTFLLEIGDLLEELLLLDASRVLRLPPGPVERPRVPRLLLLRFLLRTLKFFLSPLFVAHLLAQRALLLPLRPQFLLVLVGQARSCSFRSRYSGVVKQVNPRLSLLIESQLF